MVASQSLTMEVIVAAGEEAMLAVVATGLVVRVLEGVAEERAAAEGERIWKAESPASERGILLSSYTVAEG